MNSNHRDIIVIGASAGGFDALRMVVAALPAQNPDDAQFDQAPPTALAHVPADYVAAIEAGPLLACLEYRGPLTEVRDGEFVEYECLVGHRYAPAALLHSHAEIVQRLTPVPTT